MWTPPPTTEIDLVRSEIAVYHKEEIIQAWHSQTSEGQPWNIRLFFDQYESIKEYLAENTAADIASQIDWWTGTRMYNAGEYLGERHYGDREYCYDYYKEEATKHGESPPNHDDERFLDCNPVQGTSEWWCNYNPEPAEMAEELDNQVESWNLSQHAEFNEPSEYLESWPGLDNLMLQLNYYATNRRVLAEATERR